MIDPPTSGPGTFVRIRHWMVRKTELLSVIVMSLTAILTAWSGFQSAQWLAVQANSYGEAANDQTESVRASNEARQATSIDLAVSLSWLDAETSGDSATADFIYGGFPDRLRVATDAWLAEDPFDNPEASVSPFVMEEYVVPAAAIAEELAATAEEHTIAAQQATERANDYVLTTVLFATVLFFASLSTKFELLQQPVGDALTGRCGAHFRIGGLAGLASGLVA